KMVGQLNDYFINSQVNLQARLVDVTPLRVEENDPVKIVHAMFNQEGVFAGLQQHNRQVGADYTFMLTDKILHKGKAICGRAYAVNKTLAEIADSRRALAVIHPVCGGHTLAHELGHLMGLNHGALVDRCQPKHGHATALTPYANGFGEGNCDGKPQEGEFGDIMVGGWMGQVMGNDKASLPFFSNAKLRDPRCGESGVCGDPATGDAARVLNEHAHIYANHEQLPSTDGKPALQIEK
ncbi:MAG: hypothetical protein G8345_00920, partial [Magnetococcales bacterium]|nr:hypothetical protein [Magnetococcales bacterium]